MRLADVGPTVNLTAVVRENTDDLLAYFQRRLEHREDAADAVGEVLLVAVRRQQHLPHDPVQARMWLFGIAQRVRLNVVRGKRRRGALFDKLRADLTPVHQSDDGSADVQERVREALTVLPPNQAELVRLVHWDGFSIADASRLLGITPSAGRTRYASARHALATALEPPATPATSLNQEHRSETSQPSWVTR